MSDSDQMTSSEELRELRDSLSGVSLPPRPRLAAITARGRAHQRRRLATMAGLATAGAAAATALVLGLTGVLSHAPVPGTIRTASFVIKSNPNGTATLTISPGELLDPSALQSDLAQYGIPAMVTSGSLCTSDQAPAGFAQIVSVSPAGPSTTTPTPVSDPTITIDPSAMPAGTELSVGDFQLSSGPAAGEQQADFLLIDTSSYTCSSTPPDPSSLPAGYGPDDGIGLLYGGPGPSGS
jgi:hypothetical protein